jgi:hypothetical protein
MDDGKGNARSSGYRERAALIFSDKILAFSCD